MPLGGLETLVTRNPFPRRIDFGLSGPAPRDLIAILVVLFVTFSMSFFKTTRAVPEALHRRPRSTSLSRAWRSGRTSP